MLETVEDARRKPSQADDSSPRRSNAGRGFKFKVGVKLEVSGAVDRKNRPPREMFGGVFSALGMVS
jgi:hypothetical protein